MTSCTFYRLRKDKVTCLSIKLTDQLLEQLATLSKLNLTDADKTDLGHGLSQMIAYIDKLKELCTDETLPLTHFPELIPECDANGIKELREDTPSPFSFAQQLISLAPEQTGSYYTVPNAIDNH